MREDRFAEEPYESELENEDPQLPRENHVPSYAILATIWAAMLWHFPGGMLDWGFSAAALREGRYETILLHMFAHGGLMHIGMNSLVLFALGGIVLSYMGTSPLSWVRFFAFYLLSGLAGAAVFLMFNPNGTVPMVGASGAICGLIGVTSRLNNDGSGLIPIVSAEFRSRVWEFVRANLVLILLVTVPIFLLGGQGGIAWEAHLGGFLVGIFGARFFIDSRFL